MDLQILKRQPIGIRKFVIDVENLYSFKMEKVENHSCFVRVSTPKG